MNRVDQKKKARRLRSKAVRHDRFISQYVMKKNKQVYDEAQKEYDELDRRYPDKRDLTKTDEFTYITTGYTSLYQRNMARKKESNNRKTTPHQMPLMCKDDNGKAMELQIPLMSRDDVEVANNLSIPDNIYNDVLAEISKDSILSGIYNNMTNEQTEEQKEQQQEFDDILDELDEILPAERSSLEEELENIIYE